MLRSILMTLFGLTASCTATSEEVLKLYEGAERASYEVVTLELAAAVPDFSINGTPVPRKQYAAVTLTEGKYRVLVDDDIVLGFVIYPKRIDEMRPDKPGRHTLTFGRGVQFVASIFSASPRRRSSTASSVRPVSLRMSPSNM